MGIGLVAYNVFVDVPMYMRFHSQSEPLRLCEHGLRDALRCRFYDGDHDVWRPHMTDVLKLRRDSHVLLLFGLSPRIACAAPPNKSNNNSREKKNFPLFFFFFLKCRQGKSAEAKHQPTTTKKNGNLCTETRAGDRWLVVVECCKYRRGIKKRRTETFDGVPVPFKRADIGSVWSRACSATAHAAPAAGSRSLAFEQCKRIVHLLLIRQADVHLFLELLQSAATESSREPQTPASRGRVSTPTSDSGCIAAASA